MSHHESVIEKVLSKYPEMRDERKAKLTNTQWCSAHPASVKLYHDVEHMRRVVAAHEEVINPFSATNMQLRAARLEERMINTASVYRYVARDPETSEITDEERYTNSDLTQTQQARAYVAALN